MAGGGSFKEDSMAEKDRNQRMKEITQRLEQGVKEIFTSEMYMEYLKTMSQFHSYSFNNTLLIHLQKPDATLVAGYQAWQKKFHRQVRRGEKGIQIIAPAPIREKEEVEKIDPATLEPVLKPDGTPEMEEVEYTIPRFRITTVFDVSQTDGEPLPELATPELMGSVENYEIFMQAIRDISPVPIRFDEIESGAKGFYSSIDKEIVIQNGMSESQTMKTGIHEVTHAKLHDRDVMEEMGEKKVALFCCIPDSDKSLNYLVGMIYGQLIQTLYFVADRKYKGRLPVPVHLLIDEAPNIALPTDNFLPWLSTMRSRNIFCSYIAQNMAQIKALFKEQWESLVGLCDEFLYLGGNEKETHKYVSELMGKETLDTNTYGHSRGRNGSFSINDQQTGRELLAPDEVRMLDNRKAILFVRGERPMMDDKYDLMRHPNIRLTEDGGAAPYDYTQAKDAADDLDYTPARYDDFELLEPEDFLNA